MRNHQCSCGYGEPYRNSPSSFLSALSIGILRFPQVFSGFFRFCSHLGTFSAKKPSKTKKFISSTPSSHARFVAASRRTHGLVRLYKTPVPHRTRSEKTSSPTPPSSALYPDPRLASPDAHPPPSPRC